MTWDERCMEAAAHFDRGENGEALAIFEDLASDESADKFSRAMMCLNIATVEARQGSKIRVVKAYERAAGLALYAYVLVQAKRIEWLLAGGHFHEAERVIEKALQIDELTPADRARFEQNLATARKQGG
jgi:tetratricopeptide (TPR) repeat protein